MQTGHYSRPDLHHRDQPSEFPATHLGTPGGGALLGLEGTEGGPGSGDTAGRDGGPGAARPPGRGGPGGARRCGVGLDMGDLEGAAERLGKMKTHSHGQCLQNLQCFEPSHTKNDSKGA